MSDFTLQTDPFSLFEAWMKDAEAGEINDPNAFSLASVDRDGLPNVRVLLLKEFDRHGFVFYTNFESRKGEELLASRKAAMCFHWKSLLRQVRIRGPVEIVDDSDADAYYRSRPRGSRIGAWASQQSRPLASREALSEAVAECESRFSGEDIPRPPYWSGFRVIPLSIEFWHDREFRLHDRVIFTRSDITRDDWQSTRLYP